jgi:hypothetical protein
MPPPVPALFPVIVLRLMVSVPELLMPAPLPYGYDRVFALMVLLLTVTVLTQFMMPPPW